MIRWLTDALYHPRSAVGRLSSLAAPWLCRDTGVQPDWCACDLVAWACPGNVTAALANAGIGALLVMTVVMNFSAGSTLGFDLFQPGKWSARTTRHGLARIWGKRLVRHGRRMVKSRLVRQSALLTGTASSGTTISGTMVHWHSPVFLLHGLVTPTPAGLSSELLEWAGVGHS